jgi:hypothetical protein
VVQKLAVNNTAEKDFCQPKTAKNKDLTASSLIKLLLIKPVDNFSCYG